MVFLVVLVVAVAVMLVVVRAAIASGRTDGAPRAGGPPRRPQGPVRPIAPDDDPEFLRELGRRARKDDGSPA